MTIENVRKGERFIVVEPIVGSFGATEITLVNIGMSGAQIAHAQPLRIGTRARLWFRHGTTNASAQARVIWSHLSQDADPNGKLLYNSGLKIESADAEFAIALNNFFRRGIMQRDTESLERKRQRMLEREKERNEPVLKMIK